MGKSIILVNKLIMTHGGTDTALTNILGPTVPPTRVINWENAFNVDNKTTYGQSYYYGISDEDHTKYNTVKAVSESGNLDIKSYADTMTLNDEIYFWREDVGRNIRLVIRKTSSSQCNVFTYVYGTYTQYQGFPNRDIGWQGNEGFPLTIKLGFGYDSDNGKYILYIQNAGPYDTLMPPNGSARSNCDGCVFGYATLSSTLTILLSGNTPAPPPGPGSNPYSDGSFSEPSGDPTGDYDDTSDVISVPSVPSFNLGITSLINVWVPSTTDINNLAAYLWSNFDLTDPTKTLSKMFTDPLSYILSLHMLPFTVDSSTAITVTLAGLATTVSMPPATVQFKDIDCGSVTINEYWGNYLDYTYTKIVLCLPFCGQVDLDPDEVMGKTIKVKYRVDIITGAFVCFVYIDGDKVLGQYAGNCAAQIPISAADFSRLNAAVLGVAGAAASAFGSAALGGHGGMLNGASGGLISSIAANSQNAKVRAQHSGGLTGAPGFMGIQKPYLIIHRPRQSVPEDYEQFKGYPSNVTMQLSSCTGFTSVREIKLNGLPFTDGELSELRSILEGGVIL